MENRVTPNLTEETFDHAIDGAGISVVAFWAPWCASCTLMDDTISELALELAGDARFYRVNADDETTLINRLGIVTLPTMVFYRDGQPIERATGPKSKTALKKLVESCNAA